MTTKEHVTLPVTLSQEKCDQDETFAERLDRLVTKHGGNASVARKCEVSESVVRKWRRGQSDPTRTNLVQIANALGVSVAWLAAGEGEERKEKSGSEFNKLVDPAGEYKKQGNQPPIYIRSHRPEVEPGPPLGQMSAVPVVGTTQAGPPDHAWEEFGYPVGHGDGYLEAYTKDPNAYALRVAGDSMAPRLLEGEFCLVSPNTEPSTGEEVVVRTKAGEVMVKILAKLDAQEVILSSHNDQYQRRIVPIEEVDFLHPVVAVYRRSALLR